MTTEDLAFACGLTARNVRSYVGRGLLPQGQRVGRRVYYDQSHLARLQVVRALHSAGIPLRAIADLVRAGVTDADLVRLARQMGADARLPAQAVVRTDRVGALAAAAPRLHELLGQEGLTRGGGEQSTINAGTVGLVTVLLHHGVDETDVAALVSHGAAAARPVASKLAAVIGTDGRGRDSHVSDLKSQLVVAAFHDVLLGELVV